MNIFKKFEEQRQKAFENRLLTFYNKQAGLLKLPSISTRSYRLAENKMFYTAQDPEELVRFYTTRIKCDGFVNNNHFYRRVNASADTVLMHYNLAQRITSSMTNLLFAKEPIITVKSGNKEKDKQYMSKLEDILKDNGKMKILLTGGEMCSYSGKVGFKINLDSEVSEYPIIQCYPAENLDTIEVYGRVTDDIFKDYYKVGDTTYALYSIYGKGYIKYKLCIEDYDLRKDSEIIREVPLDTLPETAGLSDVYFYYKDGTPFDRKLSVIINNRNNGASDYEGCEDDFIAIDETYSEMATFLRRSGIKIYVPEIMMTKNGNDNQLLPFNDFANKVTQIPTSNPNWQGTEIKRDVVAIYETLKAYVDTMDSLIKRACQTAGISPATIGYEIGGANTSGEAIVVRERASIRTRDEKLVRWREGLQYLFEVLLELTTLSSLGDGRYAVDDLKKVNVYVDFPEYAHDYSLDTQLVQSITQKYNAGFITLRRAIKELYPQMEDIDIDEYVKELKEFQKERIELMQSLQTQTQFGSGEDVSLESPEQKMKREEGEKKAAMDY